MQKNSDQSGSPQKSDVRLNVVFGKDVQVEAANSQEANLIDLWRSQHQSLIHELTWIGIDQGKSFSPQTVGADPQDRQDLCELLMDISRRNRLNVSFASEKNIYGDRASIEETTGQKLPKYFWSLRGPFAAHWEGKYQRDPAKFRLLQLLIEKEKSKEDEDVPLEMRVWDWASRYFEGAATHEDHEWPIHQSQEVDDVLEQIAHEERYLQKFGLSEGEQEEAMRSIHIDFLSGDYPIVLNWKAQPESKPLLRQNIEEAVHYCRQRKQSASHAVAVILQRYRICLARGVDYREELERLSAENETKTHMLMKKAETSEVHSEKESDFVSQLAMDEEDSDDLLEFLEGIKNSRAFNPEPRFRDLVREEIRLLSEIPKTTNQEQFKVDNLIVIALKSFWLGNYFPDDLRLEMLRQKLQKAKNTSNRLQIHESFSRGCNHTGAKINAKQDSEALQLAYENDRRLIAGLSITEEEKKAIRKEYDTMLFSGDFPIYADRETPDDRVMIEKSVLDEIKERVWPFEVALNFVNYWNAIGKRPPPPREA